MSQSKLKQPIGREGLHCGMVSSNNCEKVVGRDSSATSRPLSPFHNVLTSFSSKVKGRSEGIGLAYNY